MIGLLHPKFQHTLSQNAKHIRLPGRFYRLRHRQGLCQVTRRVRSATSCVPLSIHPFPTPVKKPTPPVPVLARLNYNPLVSCNPCSSASRPQTTNLSIQAQTFAEAETGICQTGEAVQKRCNAYPVARASFREGGSPRTFPEAERGICQAGESVQRHRNAHPVARASFWEGGSPRTFAEAERGICQAGEAVQSRCNAYPVAWASFREGGMPQDFWLFDLSLREESSKIMPSSCHK
jgi:hypothetical protein